MTCAIAQFAITKDKKKLATEVYYLGVMAFRETKQTLEYLMRQNSGLLKKLLHACILSNYNCLAGNENTDA